jgi:hypothetical protein
MFDGLNCGISDDINKTFFAIIKEHEGSSA